MKNKKIMLVLGMIALVRPLLKITSLVEIFGNEAVGSIAMMLLISIVWITVIVMKRLDDPIQTAIGAGICYAVLATALSAVLSPILTGRLQGPLTHPFALVSMIATNVVWGLLVGIVSAAIVSFQKDKGE